MIDEEQQSPNSTDPARHNRRIANLLLTLVVLAAGWLVIVAKPVLLPLALALLGTLVLRPIHQSLHRLKLPNTVAAGVSIFLLITTLGATIYALSGPAVAWTRTLDLTFAEQRFRELWKPVNEFRENLSDVAQKVDTLDEDAKSDGKERPQLESESAGKARSAQDRNHSTSPDLIARERIEVKIAEDPADSFFLYAQSFGFHAGITALLVFFLLAYGDTLYRRITEGNASRELFENLSRKISSYLLTITLINLGLGCAVALAMSILGLPNPLLWGAMAATLNFIPYLGALAGTVVIGLVALTTCDTVFAAFVPPAVYYALTAIEGNFVTPMVIGKQFSLNPIIVVLWFLTWGLAWGIPGMLIATPSLMAFKIVASQIERMKTINRIISR